jgi:hypothetical protein
MAVATATSGYMTVDNGFIGVNSPLSKLTSYLTYNNSNGGYLAVTNSAGEDRVRLTTFSNGAGYAALSNSTGKEVTILNTTNEGDGYVGVMNSAGSEKAFMMGVEADGEVGLRDVNGVRRARIRGNGVLELVDLDGAVLNASGNGTGMSIISLDKFQHPRFEVRPGHINVNGTNGGENAFVGAVPGSPHLGYVGVCNGNIPGSPVKAGIYTDVNNKGIVFGI